MSEVSIKVEIAGGLYPLKIKSDDESGLKRAVDLINTKIAEFEKEYAIKDKKDVMAMVMLQLITQYMKQAESSEDELSHLKRLFAEVESMLKHHKQQMKDIE